MKRLFAIVCLLALLVLMVCMHEQLARKTRRS